MSWREPKPSTDTVEVQRISLIQIIRERDTIFHTHLCQPPSFTHNFVNYHLSHTTLSHTIFHTHLCHHHVSHTTLSTTICHTILCHDTPSFHVACVALGDIHLRFAWQAWHLWHWAGSGGALGRAWSPVTPRHFAWQAWHLATSTFVSRGRHGTWRHPSSFCVAGVALGDIYLRLAWQAWHLWHCAGSGGALGRAGDAAALCVAGVALGDIHLRFTWQAWHLETSSFCVAGVALMALGWLWRRAWAVGRLWRAALCVAGVALGDIHLRFTWQAWDLETSTFVLRGRRGTYGTGLALVALVTLVAGTALSHATFHTPSLTHTNFVTHHLSDPTLSPTIFDTPSFTHNFVTHHLWHTTLSHTIFHTPSLTHHLWHTPSFTHHLPHTIFHTHTHTIFDTPSFTHHFVTHHFVSHHLSPHHLPHTIFHHTIFHT